jgi:hypothetical protein
MCHHDDKSRQEGGGAYSLHSTTPHLKMDTNHWVLSKLLVPEYDERSEQG